MPDDGVVHQQSMDPEKTILIGLAVASHYSTAQCSCGLIAYREGDRCSVKMLVRHMLATATCTSLADRVHAPTSRAVGSVSLCTAQRKL